MSEPEVEVPEPPYTANDNDRLEGGLKCYFPDCKYIGFSWESILNHVRTRHKIKYKELKGSYLYEMGSAELMAKQKEYRARKRAADNDVEVIDDEQDVEMEVPVEDGSSAMWPAASSAMWPSAAAGCGSTSAEPPPPHVYEEEQAGGSDMCQSVSSFRVGELEARVAHLEEMMAHFGWEPPPLDVRDGDEEEQAGGGDMWQSGSMICRVDLLEARVADPLAGLFGLF